MGRLLLSLVMRPRVFSRILGQDKLLARIRKLAPVTNVWMFTGQKGSGKTTIAKIMGISYQCRHQDQFGEPCLACRKRKNDFDIREVNAAKYTKKEDLEPIAEESLLHPQPGSRKKVIILDELHRTSQASQDMFLKYLEEEIRTTVWIFNTTKPHLIDPTLQSRCLTFRVDGLDLDGIRQLISRALKKYGPGLSVGPLADAVVENSITSPRLILMACEKYIAGADPEDAARVDMSAEVDTYKICRNLTKGDWDATRLALKGVVAEDARGIRLSVAGWLRETLLSEPNLDSRAAAVANAIIDLTNMPPMEEAHQLSATIAVLFRLCQLFSKYKH